MIEQALLKFEEDGQCGKAPFVRRLAPNFMDKARHNLMFSSAIFDLCGSGEAKKTLRLPDDFSSYDWVVITAYYAMYHSALSVLASIGYKSSSHTATIVALEVFFVKKNLLEKEFLEKLKQARELEEEYVDKLRSARRQRETAQYAVSEGTGKDAAEKLLRNAREFVDRIDRLAIEMKGEGKEPAD